MSGEDVSNWFEDSTLSRMVERRTRGVTADWLLSELVRRPGEANRNSATSLTRREENQTTDRRGKASGTGPLIAFKIPTTAVIPPTCSTTAGGKSAPGSSRKPLRRPTSARCAFYGAALQAAVDEQLCFRDRRYDGRRYRETDNDRLLDGPQQPYPHPGPIDASKFHRF